MNKRSLYCGLIFLIFCANILNANNLKIAQAAAFTDRKTLVLYDAASNAVPSSSLMGFTDFPPGSASLTYTNRATVLDTTQKGRDTFAGWVASQATTTGFPILDPKAGIQMNFTLQVEDETHSNPDRAGFSVIILDQDAKGIELAFWENEIWAQNDDRTGGLFTHGEEVSFATTNGLIDYQVTIVGDTYTLSANTKPILNGPVRDYSKFEGFPDPYETPNFLFLGDDTTSSQARVRLGFVSITGTEPVQPTLTNTITSTGSPVPTASAAPPPTTSPMPLLTPAPAGKPFELCPSGWLSLSVIIASFMVVNKMRR